MKTMLGLPDGVHAGGMWRVGDEAWKPLDGRLHAGTEEHYQTQEAEALEALADIPLFPRNWRIEEANGRRWLVRRWSNYVMDSDEKLRKSLGHDTETVLQVTRDVRTANERGWEIGKDILLAYDEGMCTWFIADLSNASRNGRADDTVFVHRFLRATGFGRIADIQKAAQFLVASLDWPLDKILQYIDAHIYASWLRPIERTWGDLPDGVELVHQRRSDTDPYTWIIAPEPLGEDTLDRYELDWCWSPVHPTEEVR